MESPALNVRMTAIAVVCAALALPVVAMPVTARADTRTATKAFDACTRDLAGRLSLNVVAQRYNPTYTDPLGVLMRPQKIEVVARSVRTHRIVARAECAYDNAGQVVGIVRQPSQPLLTAPSTQY